MGHFFPAHTPSDPFRESQLGAEAAYWLKIEATTTAVAVRSARLRLMDVQIYRTAPWRATAVFAGAERDDDDDDDGLAWGEVISYEPSPDLGDVPVAVPIPSAPPAEAAPSAPRAAEVAPAAYAS